MKNKVLIVSCLILIIFVFSYQKGIARSVSAASSKKIGVVSVLNILRDCKRNEKYRGKIAAEQDKLEVEFRELEADIRADEAGLKTLKPNTDDYLDRAKALMQKQAGFQAQQEFYKRRIELKYQQWVEKLYKDILSQVKKVARQKGLDIVIEQTEPELPVAGYTALMTIMSTHKVLYSQGCVNITAEVLALVDAMK